MLGHAVFKLGCSLFPELSLTCVQAFKGVLESLRSPLQVETLTIDLRAYAFRSDRQLQDFCCDALKNVKVRKMLILKGLDVHLELNVRSFPAFLGMSIQPLRYDVRFRTAHWKELGAFTSMHIPLAQYPKAGELVTINDPTSKYDKWLQTAPQDHIVNGLDYVTDHGVGL